MGAVVDERSDAALVARVRGGDVRAFEPLVERHAPQVYRLALRMLGDSADAQDAAQDAFLQAWRGLPGFREDSSFQTWISRIVVNRCLNLLRARRAREPLVLPRPSPEPGPERAVEARSQLAALTEAVMRLPPAQRAAFVLREFEGCSYDEIAEILGISTPATKSRLHRARVEVLQAMRGWT